MWITKSASSSLDPRIPFIAYQDITAKDGKFVGKAGRGKLVKRDPTHSFVGRI